MRNQLKTVLAVLLVAAAAVVFTKGYRQKAEGDTMPRVFLLDAKQVQLTRQRIRDSDKSLTAAWDRLQRDAQKALSEGPFSIVNKSVTPPSGDKHDYMTQAPYFWPDPKSPNGLPYIRRDGERNPEINRITDHHSLDQLESSVETLALAYYFKGDEAYAAKAVQLLRAFFLDAATRMNPNLQYAQFIPGVKPISVVCRTGLESSCNGCRRARTAARKRRRRTIMEPTTMCRWFLLHFFSAREIWQCEFFKRRGKKESPRKSSPMVANLWN